MTYSNPVDPEDFLLNPQCFDRRSEFLIEVYRQTSTHLGRHIAGVWQCVGVVGAALVVFALDKDKSLNDYACTFVVLLCGWLGIVTLDASNWFNRNLAIITNIERLFLTKADLTFVHPFFSAHRRPGHHAKHFTIQFLLAGAIGVLVITYHFVERVRPGMSQDWSCFEIARTLPYGTALLVLMVFFGFSKYYRKRATEFQRDAPGITI